jgi:hypothetical protein
VISIVWLKKREKFGAENYISGLSIRNCTASKKSRLFEIRRTL